MSALSLGLLIDVIVSTSLSSSHQLLWLRNLPDRLQTEIVLGTSRRGYELSWVRVFLGTSWLGYELSWVRVVLGTSCPQSIRWYLQNLDRRPSRVWPSSIQTFVQPVLFEGPTGTQTRPYLKLRLDKLLRPLRNDLNFSFDVSRSTRRKPGRIRSICRR